MRNPAWYEDRWRYESTQPAIDAMLYAEPDARHVEDPGREAGWVLPGKYVDWLVNSSYVVWVPADMVNFMEGNQWNWPHARALYDAIESGGRPIMELPAGRVYPVTKALVASTQADYDADELSYQRGMSRPFEPKEVGSYWAQLLDGNHRALAAIAAGEEMIPVVVGENYRGDIRSDSWLAEPKRPKRPRRKRNPDARTRREERDRDPHWKLEAWRRGQAVPPDVVSQGIWASWELPSGDRIGAQSGDYRYMVDSMEFDVYLYWSPAGDDGFYPQWEHVTVTVPYRGEAWLWTQPALQAELARMALQGPRYPHGRGDEDEVL